MMKWWVIVVLGAILMIGGAAAGLVITSGTGAIHVLVGLNEIMRDRSE